MRRGYSEYRYWSVLLGSDASRLSVFNDHGDEYFCIIDRSGSAKAYREAKAEAVAKLVDAAESGREPGEVW